MPTNRSNVTDVQQSVLEEAQYEGGIPVFEKSSNQTPVTRVVVKVRGGSQRTLHGTTLGIHSNNGVVYPHDDTPTRFTENTIGKP